MKTYEIIVTYFDKDNVEKQWSTNFPATEHSLLVAKGIIDEMFFHFANEHYILVSEID